MNVLNVNKFYYLKGGSERYFFALKNLLEEKGITVIPFSMKAPDNIECEYESYFIDHISYLDSGLKDKILSSLKVIYSVEARKKIEKLIDITKPDIAHLHVFQHQMSPSILFGLKKHGIPVVYTAHDLKVLCGSYKMLNKNEICEACRGNRHVNCLKRKCVKNSSLGSMVTMIEMYIHDALRSYKDNIDVIITPSRFYRQKYMEYGFSPQKVIHIPNFIDADQFQPSYTHDNYFLYLGRLSEEKGILTLVEAMKEVKRSKLYIVGTGPMEREVQEKINSSGIQNIRMLGYRTGEELASLMKSAQFIILPSEWYENGPMSLLEAYGYGKPVIGSDIGGITEHIKDGETGLLFRPGAAQELAEKINRLLEEPDTTAEMGRYARKLVEQNFNKELHFQQIYNLYKGLGVSDEGMLM